MYLYLGTQFKKEKTRTEVWNNTCQRWWVCQASLARLTQKQQQNLFLRIWRFHHEAHYQRSVSSSPKLGTVEQLLSGGDLGFWVPSVTCLSGAPGCLCAWCSILCKNQAAFQSSSFVHLPCFRLWKWGSGTVFKQEQCIILAHSFDK